MKKVNETLSKLQNPTQVNNYAGEVNNNFPCEVNNYENPSEANNNFPSEVNIYFSIEVNNSFSSEVIIYFPIQVKNNSNKLLMCFFYWRFINTVYITGALQL